MEITKLINRVKDNPNSELTRGGIIDYIANNCDDWIMVLKSLLIKHTSKYIFKTYLLEKLDFMKRNPNDPQGFLDFDGMLIFNILRK